MIKTEIKPKINQNYVLNTQVIIFNHENSDTNLLERSMLDWVRLSVQGFQVKVVNYNNLTELEQIKSNLTNSEFTIVLHSFTPLLTQNNILNTLDYLVLKQEKLIKLPFGYMFETEYVKSLNQIKEPVCFSYDSSEFLKIESAQEIGYATEVLQTRILKHFIENGVNIVNPNAVTINAFVKIESGVTIYPFNTLCGDTMVYSGTVLKEGNTLTNADIGKNTIIANSIVTNSTICADCVVFPFNTIINGTYVGNNCTIKSYNQIANAKIEDDTTIESFNNIE